MALPVTGRAFPVPESGTFFIFIFAPEHIADDSGLLCRVELREEVDEGRIALVEDLRGRAGLPQQVGDRAAEILRELLSFAKRWRLPFFQVCQKILARTAFSTGYGRWDSLLLASYLNISHKDFVVQWYHILSALFEIHKNLKLTSNILTIYN